MTSRKQRDAGADHAARGWVGDPLKLPFARILQEVRGVRLGEANRRVVQAIVGAQFQEQMREAAD